MTGALRRNQWHTHLIGGAPAHLHADDPGRTGRAISSRMSTRSEGIDANQSQSEPSDPIRAIRPNQSHQTQSEPSDLAIGRPRSVIRSHQRSSAGIRPNQSQSDPIRAIPTQSDPIRPNQPSDLAPGKSIGRVAQARALPKIGALAVEEWSGDPKLTWRRRTTLVPGESFNPHSIRPLREAISGHQRGHQGGHQGGHWRSSADHQRPSEAIRGSSAVIHVQPKGRPRSMPEPIASERGLVALVRRRLLIPHDGERILSELAQLRHQPCHLAPGVL
jgi:hypothetical protein